MSGLAFSHQEKWLFCVTVNLIKFKMERLLKQPCFLIFPHVMIQVGLTPFPPQTGAHLVQPGPMTHEGLLFDEQDAAEGEKTLASINFMVEDMRDWKHTNELPLVDELKKKLERRYDLVGACWNWSNLYH
jgi:hypothetical protein